MLMPLEIRVVASDTDLLALRETAEVLDQGRYILEIKLASEESLLIGAFEGERCIGFLRLLVQVIGHEEGRPPVLLDNVALREGYVEAFGVLPAYRRQGIGQKMQEFAMTLCKERGCYQIRSRSPVTSRENYALKLKMGYTLHPSAENDSYYFIKTCIDINSV